MMRLGLLVLLLLSSMAQAQAPLTIKGLALGISSSDLLRQFPELKCDGNVCQGPERACIKKAEQWYLDQECAERYRYGGIEPLNYDVTLENDRVMVVVIKIRSSDFETLVEAMRARFGKATHDDKSVLQNAMGAKFDNRALVWTRRSADTVLMIEKRVEQIDTGRVSLFSNSFMDRNQKLHRNAAKERAKDL